MTALPPSYPVELVHSEFGENISSLSEAHFFDMLVWAQFPQIVGRHTSRLAIIIYCIFTTREMNGPAGGGLAPS